MRKVGAGVITAVSVFMTAAALFGFSASHSFLLLCLWAVPYGLGRGRGGCCAQQLCGAAFFLSPYELAALLLERWRSGQPLYHELLPDGRVRLEQRLPLCRCCSDDFDSGVIPQPSALEAAPIRRGGRGERGKGAEPAAGP